MSAVFEVKLEEAVKFSKVWNYNGISIILTPEALAFAKDFANVAIRSFIDVCQQQAAQAAKQAEAKSKIIMEGV